MHNNPGYLKKVKALSASNSFCCLKNASMPRVLKGEDISKMEKSALILALSKNLKSKPFIISEILLIF